MSDCDAPAYDVNFIRGVLKMSNIPSHMQEHLIEAREIEQRVIDKLSSISNTESGSQYTRGWVLGILKDFLKGSEK